jgi:hypothetical protein
MIRWLAGLAAAWALDEIGAQEILTGLGLGLVAIGLWLLSHAAALIVVGVLLLWMVVPTRPRFVTAKPARDRKDVG